MTTFTVQDLQAHVKSGRPTTSTLFSALSPELAKNVPMRSTAPKVVCADGFKVSIQASAYHYCTPRDNEGPYETVELGFPSEEVDAWLEYADEPGNPTGTVYGQVPVDLVVTVINDHGGVKV